MSQEESFLGRWSRRKSQALQEEQEPLPEETPPLTNPAETSDNILLEEEQTTPEAVDIKELTDEDMPPIESLNEDSDYTGFMSPKVSEELRKIALRKLFSGAGFNVRDGLDDYDEDFSLSTFEPLGDIITSDMKHQIEVEAERKLREAMEAEETDTTPETKEAVASDEVEEEATQSTETEITEQETQAPTSPNVEAESLPPKDNTDTGTQA